MVGIVVVCRCYECEVEGGLEYHLDVSGFLMLAVKPTYPLHPAEFVSSDLDNGLGLQP